MDIFAEVDPASATKIGAAIGVFGCALLIAVATLALAVYPAVSAILLLRLTFKKARCGLGFAMAGATHRCLTFGYWIEVVLVDVRAPFALLYIGADIIGALFATALLIDNARITRVQMGAILVV